MLNILKYTWSCQEILQTQQEILGVEVSPCLSILDTSGSEYNVISFLSLLDLLIDVILSYNFACEIAHEL